MYRGACRRWHSGPLSQGDCVATAAPLIGNRDNLLGDFMGIVFAVITYLVVIVALGLLQALLSVPPGSPFRLGWVEPGRSISTLIRIGLSVWAAVWSFSFFNGLEPVSTLGVAVLALAGVAFYLVKRFTNPERVRARV